MREIETEMPKRPVCSGCDRGDVRTIYVYVKPGSKALHIRIDCIEWLLAYAGDEDHFQGIARTNEDNAIGTAVADYLLEWDFNAKVWGCQIMAGAHTGQRARQAPTVLSRDF